MRKGSAAQLVLCLILAACALVLFLPFAWMLLGSFRPHAEIVQAKTILPDQFTFENYGKVFATVPILRWFQNSLLVTVSATAIILFTSTLIGFVFAKYQFPRKNLLFGVILATMMVPAQATMIPSFLIINGIGLYDRLGALVLPGMVSGFGIFLCRQFIEEVPDSLCEAALIDGAGDFYIYARIILPLCRPAVGALTIFTFLQYWNDYLSPLLYLNKPQNMTLSLAISFFSSQRSADIGAILAAATLVMLPVTVLFLACQKQFIKGIAITGMK